MPKISKFPSMKEQLGLRENKYNIWLIQRNKQPELYFQGLSEEEALGYIQGAARKVFDGAAVGFMLMDGNFKVARTITSIIN